MFFSWVEAVIASVVTGRSLIDWCLDWIGLRNGIGLALHGLGLELASRCIALDWNWSFGWDDTLTVWIQYFTCCTLLS